MERCSNFRLDGYCTAVRPGKDGVLVALTGQVIWLSQKADENFPSHARERMFTSIDGVRMVCEAGRDPEAQAECNAYEPRE